MAESRFADAEPLYQGALTVVEKVRGVEHADVAIGLDNLAVVHYQQKQYREAEPLLQRALAIREKVLGPEHVDIATSLNNLGNTYYHQKRYDEAEQLLLDPRVTWRRRVRLTA